MATTTLKSEKRSVSVFPMGTVILIIIVLIGAYATVVRYSQGLGAATNLNDSRPWGLWIGLDVMSGVALAAGGFTLAAIVYIFRIKELYPLIRPTILTAFLGYLLAAGAILFDLGQPTRFWHPFVFWNHHSVMFEIAWSVITYLTILSIENSPLVAEKFKWKWLLRILRMITIPVVILGIIISTMHQSSLGGLFLLAPQRMNPLWYTALLPLLFYVSAIMVGLAMVIIESTFSANAYGRPSEINLLSKIGGWIPYVLGLYLILNLGNLLISGKFGLIFTSGAASILFLIEIVGGVIVPLILLAMPKVRRDSRGLFTSAMLIAGGVVLNRFNVMFFGQGGTFYAPSWMEFAVSAGLIAVGILIYMFTVKFFPVFEQHAH